MDLNFLNDQCSSYVLSLFVQEDEVPKVLLQLKPYAEHKWVHISLQPCPYEGIEFLYRAPINLPAQRVSIDRSVYWHALELDAEISQEQLADIGKHHHEFLISILSQDDDKVGSEQNALMEFFK